MKKLDILFVLLVCLDVHPTCARNSPKPITTGSQAPSHGIYERMILFPIERVESIGEGGESDGIESEFGEVGTDVDSVVSETMPLAGQYPLFRGIEDSIPS